MFEIDGNIRLSIKGIIIKDNKILLTKNHYNGEDFYLLPGGGQKHGERIDEALNRECFEEIGSHVEIKRLIFIRDYIGKNHQFKNQEGDVHQVELMFSCKLLNENPSMTRNKDEYQIGIEWIPLNELKQIRIYPRVLKEVIHSDGTFDEKEYLGDMS